MKKLFTLIKSSFLLALLLAALGCKKANQSGPSDADGQTPLHVVSFTTTGYRTSTTVLSTPAAKATNAIGDTLQNYADNLYYRVYDASGAWIKSIDQKATDPNFGTVVDRLPAGTYKVFFAASKTELLVSGKGYSYNDSYFGQLAYNLIWSDTFSKGFDLTVGTADVNQNVRLERAVAGCQIVMPDGLPKAITQLKIQFQGEFQSLPLTAPSTGTGNIRGMEVKYDAANYKPGAKTVTFYIANTAKPIRFTLYAYNSAGVELASKVIDNVLFEKNKMTTLTGNLFPANSVSDDFVVGINPYWTDGRTERF
jgi:hypothetical protein